MRTNLESDLLPEQKELGKFLTGKKGIAVDSPILSDHFSDVVESFGKITIIESIPDDFLETIKKEGVDFLLIHNYLLKDKETIMDAHSAGVKIALFTRTIVPSKEYRVMEDELEKEEVSIWNSLDRDYQSTLVTVLEDLFLEPHSWTGALTENSLQ